MPFVLLFHRIFFAQTKLMAKLVTDKIDLKMRLELANIACFGVDKNSIPDILFNKVQGFVEIFSSETKSKVESSANVYVKQHWKLSDIRRLNSTICFLDNKASKVLLAKFPSEIRFIFIRLVPRVSWFLAFPGLLRRLAERRISVLEVIKLQTGQSFTRWLVLENIRIRPSRQCSFLSMDIGVQGFLDYLREEKVKYVVLRFYESLPNLSRVGGDLDILVADEDEEKVKDFLFKNPGLIRVDVWSVSRKFDEVAYIPPPLARKIIATAIDGPARSRIPAPKEAFLSLAYHALYDKGVDAGIPSRLPDIKVNKFPNNDYGGTLAKMAEKLGLKIDMTMEGIDEYLHSEGWRPKTDTLANKMRENTWIKKRFFSNASKQTPEIGLGVFIIKEKAVQANLADNILREITKNGKFLIFKTKKIVGEEQRLVADQLRSGFWTESLDLGQVNNFLPALAVVILNWRLLYFSKNNAGNKTSVAMAMAEIKDLKSKIRKLFDTEKTSLVHSTDTSSEGWEYIDACFPGEASEIRKEIELIRNNLELSLLEKIKLHALGVLYNWKMYKHDLRQYIVERIIS